MMLPYQLGNQMSSRYVCDHPVYPVTPIREPGQILKVSFLRMKE